MARSATGSVRTRKLADGETVFHARIRAYGERHEFKLGETPTWTAGRAQDEVDQILRQVRLGIWSPHKRTLEEQRNATAPQDPTVHELLSDFVASVRALGRADTTMADLAWRVTKHLLPFFHAPVTGYNADGSPIYGQPRRFSELTEALVDEYMAEKQQEARDIENLRAARAAGVPEEEFSPRHRWLLAQYGRSSKGLNPTSINATLTTLRRAIQMGMRRHPGLLHYNVADGKRVTAEKPDRSFLELDAIEALLDAAVELDAKTRYEIGRRAAVATFTFCGLRNQELAATRLRDVDLFNRLLLVPDAKTAAGIRRVNIPPAAAAALKPWLARRRELGAEMGDLVWPLEGSGTQRDRNNVRRRLLGPSVERAREMLAERDQLPMPDEVRPHTLRRTFATILFMNGESPPYVMGQMGHTDAKLTLEIYAQVSQRRGPKDPRLERWLGAPGVG
jgi:integrase